MIVGQFGGGAAADWIAGEGTGSRLFTGAGDGTFTSALLATPAIVAAGRLTADELDDLVATFGDTVALYRNLDGGDFERSSYQVFTAPVFTAVADLTPNGLDDIVAWSSGQLFFLESTGDGDLAPAVELVSGAPDPQFTDGMHVAAGDLDGNGRIDLVVDHVVYLRSPAGLLTAVATVAFDHGPCSWR